MAAPTLPAPVAAPQQIITVPALNSTQPAIVRQFGHWDPLPDGTMPVYTLPDAVAAALGLTGLNKIVPFAPFNADFLPYDPAQNRCDVRTDVRGDYSQLAHLDSKNIVGLAAHLAATGRPQLLAWLQAGYAVTEDLLKHGISAEISKATSSTLRVAR